MGSSQGPSRDVHAVSCLQLSSKYRWSHKPLCVVSMNGSGVVSPLGTRAHTNHSELLSCLDPNLIMTEGLAALTQPFTDSVTTSRLVSCEWVKPSYVSSCYRASIHTCVYSLIYTTYMHAMVQSSSCNYYGHVRGVAWKRLRFLRTLSWHRVSW